LNIESYRSFCLSKKGVTEEFPFGEETMVFKVMGKMFGRVAYKFQGQISKVGKRTSFDAYFLY